jgi:multiple sugar transport system permease protein
MVAMARDRLNAGVPRGRRRFRRLRHGIVPYLFILPLMSVIGFLRFYPMAKTLDASLYHIDPLSPPTHFVGLKNYGAVIHDSQFQSSLWNTLVYVLVGTVLLTVLGLAFALALWKPFKLRPLVLAIMIMPWALPGVVEGITWQWMYDGTFGLLNRILTGTGLAAHYQIFIGLHHFETIFLTELVQVWQLAPLQALLFLAGLQAIPDELYDAASVDGGTTYQRFVHVTLPLIRPSLAIVVVNSMLASLTIFDIVIVLNGGTGAVTTNPLMVTIYTWAFEDDNFGQAYASVFLLSFAIIMVSVVLLRAIHRKVEF